MRHRPFAALGKLMSEAEKPEGSTTNDSPPSAPLTPVAVLKSRRPAPYANPGLGFRRLLKKDVPQEGDWYRDQTLHPEDRKEWRNADSTPVIREGEEECPIELDAGGVDAHDRIWCRPVTVRDPCTPEAENLARAGQRTEIPSASTFSPKKPSIRYPFVARAHKNAAAKAQARANIVATHAVAAGEPLNKVASETLTGEEYPSCRAYIDAVDDGSSIYFASIDSFGVVRRRKGRVETPIRITTFLAENRRFLVDKSVKLGMTTTIPGNVPVRRVIDNAAPRTPQFNVGDQVWIAKSRLAYTHYVTDFAQPNPDDLIPVLATVVNVVPPSSPVVRSHFSHVAGKLSRTLGAGSESVVPRYVLASDCRSSRLRLFDEYEIVPSNENDIDWRERAYSYLGWPVPDNLQVPATTVSSSPSVVLDESVLDMTGRYTMVVSPEHDTTPVPTQVENGRRIDKCYVTKAAGCQGVFRDASGQRYKLKFGVYVANGRVCGHGSHPTSGLKLSLSKRDVRPLALTPATLGEFGPTTPTPFAFSVGQQVLALGSQQNIEKAIKGEAGFSLVQTRITHRHQAGTTMLDTSRQELPCVWNSYRCSRSNSAQSYALTRSECLLFPLNTQPSEVLELIYSYFGLEVPGDLRATHDESYEEERATNTPTPQKSTAQKPAARIPNGPAALGNLPRNALVEFPRTSTQPTLTTPAKGGLIDANTDTISALRARLLNAFADGAKRALLAGNVDEATRLLKMREKTERADEVALSLLADALSLWGLSSTDEP